MERQLRQNTNQTKGAMTCNVKTVRPKKAILFWDGTVGASRTTSAVVQCPLFDNKQIIGFLLWWMTASY